MPRYDVTRRALADLRDIVRYTRETWGRKQARLYREEIPIRHSVFQYRNEPEAIG